MWRQPLGTPKTAQAGPTAMKFHKSIAMAPTSKLAMSTSILGVNDFEPYRDLELIYIYIISEPFQELLYNISICVILNSIKLGTAKSMVRNHVLQYQDRVLRQIPLLVLLVHPVHAKQVTYMTLPFNPLCSRHIVHQGVVWAFVCSASLE